MFWNMCRFNCYQLKADHYIFRKLYMNLMVTTKQKYYNKYTKENETEYEQNTKENHQTTMEEKEEERNRGIMKTTVKQ